LSEAVVKSQQWSRIAIVIASSGRPVELGRWIDYMRRQTLRPAALFFAVTKPSDLPSCDEVRNSAKVLFCQPGLPIQRNVALEEAIGSSDIVAFFDDDYVPSSYCIEGIDLFFRGNPDVAGVNGTLLADGINSVGIDYQEAAEIVARHDSQPQPVRRRQPKPPAEGHAAPFVEEILLHNYRFLLPASNLFGLQTPAAYLQ